MRKSLALLAAVGLLVVSIGPAGAKHASVKGSFDASGYPFPLTGSVDPGGCANGQEGVHRTSKAFKAPYDGVLHAEMAEFTGDWDLHVIDEDGVVLMSSTSDNVTSDPSEILDVRLAPKQKVSIVACNWAGGPSARVEYAFRHSAPPPVFVPPVPKKKITRVEKAQYTGPAVGTAATGGQLCHVGYDVGCVGFYPEYDEYYATISITDATGLPVAAAFYQYAGDEYLGSVSFCGSTDGPLDVHPDADFVGVEVLIGPCADNTPAMATTGEVKVVFSNAP